MNNLELLTVYEFDNKIRCGIKEDGGYVFGSLDVEYDCFISAGVSNEESFSRDFINQYGMNKSNSFAFDGTISNYPYHYTNKITFFKKNIDTYNDDTHTDLSFLTDQYSNIFLKMDIEGGEYPWILSMAEEQLQKCAQIVIELHGITDDSYGSPYSDKVKCLEKLASTHYLIHAHANNYGAVVNGFPDVIELSYVNKRFFQSAPAANTQPLPIANLDYPNYNKVPDVDLNFYPFTQA